MKTLKKDQLKSKKILGVPVSTVAKSFAVLGLVATMYSCEEESCDNDTPSVADPASSSSDSDTTSYSDDC